MVKLGISRQKTWLNLAFRGKKPGQTWHFAAMARSISEQAWHAAILSIAFILPERSATDASFPFLPKESFWGANKTLAVF